MTDRRREYRAAVSKQGLTVVCGAQGKPAHYPAVTKEMRAVKEGMRHPEAKTFVTQGLGKNATIELYRSGCDDDMVKAVTGHSGAEMAKNYGGMVRQRELATTAQQPRNRAEQTKFGTGKFQRLFEISAW